MNIKNDSNREPIVTVVIPTFNCLEFLPKAINSVLNQEIENIEIFVIDDGSTDNTWEWLQIEASIDNRVIPLSLNRKGVSYARNYAISKANSKFIAFLDADDYWEPGKLKKQLDFHMNNSDVVLSFTDYKHVDMKGNSLGQCFEYWTRFHRNIIKSEEFQKLDDSGVGLIFSENVVGTSTVVASRIALQNANGFDVSLDSASDWDLWLKLGLSGNIGYCSQSYMTYLVRPGSITSKIQKRLDAINDIIARHKEPIRRYDPYSLFFVKSRIASGYADLYRQQKKSLAALMSDICAFLYSPSTRTAKTLASDFLVSIKLH